MLDIAQGLDFQTAQSLMLVITIAGYRDRNPDAARALIPRSRAYVRRNGFHDHLQWDLLVHSANVYAMQGHLERAIDFDKSAARLARQTHGPNSETYLVSMNNIGATQYLIGQYDDARRTLERNLIEKRQQLEPDPAGELFAQSNLALVYAALGEIHRVDELLSDVLEIAVLLHFEDSEPHIRALWLTADVALFRHQPKTALAALERAEAIQIQNLGPEHPGLYTVHHRFATALLAAGKHQRAAYFADKTQREIEQTKRESSAHQDLLTAMLATSHAYLELRRLGDARRIYIESLESVQKHPEESRPLLARRNWLGAQLARSNGEHEKAMRLLEQIFDDPHAPFFDIVSAHELRRTLAHEMDELELYRSETTWIENIDRRFGRRPQSRSLP